MNKKQCFRGYLLVLYVFTLFTLCTGALSAQQFAQEKTVKVGYYHSHQFQEGANETEPKSGFGYEYLQKVSDYTGWSYEYVYSDWTTLLHLLEEGSIDIMAGVSVTSERIKKISYPDSKMGLESYYIFSREQGSDLTSDYKNLENSCIGGLADNLMTEYLLRWSVENGINIDVKYYTDFDSLDEAFKNGTIDYFVYTDNNVLNSSSSKPIVKLGESPYYLAVTKGRSDLLNELNTALSKLSDLEPFFLQNLEYTAYGNTAAAVSFTTEEIAWLKEHDEIVVGYMAEYMPFCDYDKKDGTTGLLVDVLNEMIRELNLENSINIRYESFKDYYDLVNALHIGLIDVAFPVGYDPWYLEKDKVTATTPVLVVSADLAFKGSFNDKVTSIIGVNVYNKLQYYYTLMQYPKSKIVMYESIGDCLKAVKRDEVKSTILNGLRLDSVAKNNSYSDLSLLQLQKPISISFGVESGNTSLLMILNRGLKAIGRDYGINASYNYAGKIYSVTVKDVIKNHLFMISSIVSFLLSTIIVLLLVIINRMKIEKKTRKEFDTALAIARRDSINAKIESNTDSLTGFFNRRAFEEDLYRFDEEKLSDDTCIFSLDVNGLKTINDTLGHQAGDEMIEGASYSIKGTFGTKARYYRTGGDEFVVICQMPKEDLGESVKRLSLNASQWQGNFSKGLTISCGYVRMGDFPDKSIFDLSRLADKKMYEDKSVFYSSRNDRRSGNQRTVYQNLLNTYLKILKVDLQNDSYEAIKMREYDKLNSAGFSKSFFLWLKEFAEAGNVYKDDLKEYLAKTDEKYIKEWLKNNKEPLHIFYRRLDGPVYKPAMLEIVASEDYSSTNQLVYIYVKNI